MNYTELVAAVKQWVQIDETTFNNNIDIFIGNGEKRIYREVRGLPAQKKLVTGSATMGNKYLGMPSDFMSSYSMSVIDGGTYYPLGMKNEGFIYAAYPDSLTARPKYYAVLDNHCFLLGPTPDAAYSMEFHYYIQPDSIVTATTTWLGDNAAQALLYAVLLEAGVFMKAEADMMNTYKAGYDIGVEELKKLTSDIKDDAFRQGDL